MAWEVGRLDEAVDSTIHQKHGAAESESTAHDIRPANFTDIITNELVLICVTSYLNVPSLVSLSSTNKEIRSVMHTTPNVWRTIDLSDLWSSNTDLFLLKFLRQPYVSRDCRLLILDGLNFDHSVLDQILLREMPMLRSISLLSCPNLNGDQIIKLIDYIRRPSNPQPLTLRYISLFGAPLFPLDQSSEIAPIIVAAAGSEIITDLHSLQCRLGRRRGALQLAGRGRGLWCCRHRCKECEPYPSVSIHFLCV